MTTTVSLSLSYPGVSTQSLSKSQCSFATRLQRQIWAQARFFFFPIKIPLSKASEHMPLMWHNSYTILLEPSTAVTCYCGGETDPGCSSSSELRAEGECGLCLQNSSWKSEETDGSDVYKHWGVGSGAAICATLVLPKPCPSLTPTEIPALPSPLTL